MKIINASDPKYRIERLNDPYAEADVELFTSLMMDKTYKTMHWRGAIDNAKKCYEYFDGKIFDEQKRQKLIDQNKVPIELKEYKPFINSLTQNLIKAKPNGKVEQSSFNSSETSVSAEDMDAVLQKIKKDMRIDHHIAEILRDGLISGYFQSVLFDVEHAQYGGNGKLVLRRYPYDSVLVGRSWNGDPNEINDCIFANILTYEEIKEQFPEKAKVIDEYIENHYNTDTVITPPDNFLGVSNENWADFVQQMTVNWGGNQNSNGWTVYRWIRPLTAKTVRYIDYGTGDVQILSDVWSQEQQNTWIAEHPEYERIEEYAKVLWETTVTQTGIILDNAPSWYQNNGEIPAAFFVADIVDRKPCGVMSDLLNFIYVGAVCETEGLSQVIRGNRSMTWAEEGSVTNEENITEELSKEIGFGTFKPGRMPPAERQATPNLSYINHADRNAAKAQQALRVNNQMLGDIGQYQNKKGIETALAQGIEAQGGYLRNLVSFDLRLNRIILNAIPVFMTEEELIKIENEFGEEREILVNETETLIAQPEREGEPPRTVANIIANDLTSAKYYYNIVTGDYSNMTREESMNKFINFFNQGGANLAIHNPQLFSDICNTYPDRYFREVGKRTERRLIEQQEQQAQAAEAEKQEVLNENMQERVFELIKEALKRAIPQVITNVRPEAIVEAPEGFEATIAYQQEAIANSVNTAVNAISQQFSGNGQGQGQEMGLEEMLGQAQEQGAADGAALLQQLAKGA